ncbi:LysR family transcriptional regulator [Phenylobacterium montanum]|uniref:LysR family transcriptional regulator n=1 Tax=Phenylobacterium montanum TaxID=2823693 RepID=A0A975ITG2_9CAUL|nr:LysR family transcriptional regulator [Caulobacter sp. S6]QUD86700.1 LysR family transcriptional regulator [Caulobacter sp. S6]
MSKDVDWSLYRTLRAVLRAGSLSGAARTLGLSQPTVGRHIEQLEQALGLPLFTRSPTGLRPTDLARELGPYLETMASAAAAAARDASAEADEVAGVVRVTASEIIGAEVLPPILAEFNDLYPKVVVELVLSNRAEDLLRRAADIAVRMVRPTQGALLAKRIGSLEIGLYAHRRYLQRRGTPAIMADVADHAVIGYDQESSLGDSVDDLTGPVSRETFTFRADSDLAQLAALRAGFGIGGCQVGIARRDPNLVRVLPDAFGFQLETWVVMHEDLKASRRMRLMFDHLAEGLTAYIVGAQPETPVR